MSSFAQIQINPPQDWQAFERASAILWSLILDDPHLARFGRTGQAQFGLDITGYRNGDTSKLVGIQCKCIKSPGKLQESAVREELKKAEKYNPPLAEYIITTTAENDATLDQLAHTLTAEYSQQGRNFIVRIWGWGTLQENIQNHKKAWDAFDPQHSPAFESIDEGIKKLGAGQEQIIERQEVSASNVTASIEGLRAEFSNFRTAHQFIEDADASDHQELDRYRELLHEGKPIAALSIIEAKEASLGAGATAAVRSRLKALAAHCYWHLGNDAEAIQKFNQAADIAPTERRGIAARVLSAMVAKEFRKAFELALAAIRVDPANENVIPWLLYSASRVPELEFQIEIIPQELRKSQGFTEAYVDYLRSRSIRPDWWTTAREGLANFPKSTLLKLASVDADLDEFLETTDFQKTKLFENDWRTRLQTNSETLARLLQLAEASDHSANPIIPALAGSLTLVYGLLDNYEAAKSVVESALRRFPDDRDLVLKAAQVSLEVQSEQLEDLCLPKLGHSGPELLMRVLILSRRNRWAELALIADNADYGSVSSSDKKMARLLIKAAKVRILPEDQRQVALDALLNSDDYNDEHLVVVANVAAALGFSQIAEIAFSRALAALSSDSHISTRLNIAIAAEDREEWADVIKLLENHIDTKRNTHELRMLARAYANTHPVTDKALRFFHELPEDIRETAPFNLIGGFINLKAGILDTALRLFRHARDNRPGSTTAFLNEVQTLVLLQREGELKSVVSALDYRGLQGTPADLMKVAHVLSRYGRREEALQFGYYLIRKFAGDPDAELLYCGLFLNDDGKQDSLLQVVKIEDGTWIKVVDQFGQSADFIIDSREQGSMDVAHPEDERARPFIGAKVGDFVEIPRPYFDPVKWKVAEIKHRFVHALNYVMDTFNIRHPHHLGMQKMVFQDNDVKPFLDLIRMRAENAEQTGVVYDSHPVPIAVIGARSGGSSIDFLHFLELRSAGIRTCSGSLEEQEEANNLVSNLSGRNAVLDITALWTALRLDALQILAKVFGKLRLAESTLREVLAIRDRLVDELGRKGATAVYKDGRYYSSDFDDDQTKQQIELVEGYLQKIDEWTEISPAVLPEEFNSDLVSTLTGGRHPHIIDAIIVSANSKVLLVSEDRDFRNAGKLIAKMDSTWLQPAFRRALEMGIIEVSRYAELTIGLAKLRHGHISLDALTLITIANERSTEFRFVAEYVGVKQSEINSHVDVVRAFAANYWTGQKIPKPIRKSMSLLLEKLIRFRNLDWHNCLAIIALLARDNSGLLKFLTSWATNRGMKTRPLKRRFAILQAARRKRDYAQH